MTHKQALQLQIDWGKALEPRDFNETLYLSINGVGTKVFKKCCHHEHEGYLFIWTLEESFFIKKKDLGDFILVDGPVDPVISLKKKKKVT